MTDSFTAVALGIDKITNKCHYHIDRQRRFANVIRTLEWKFAIVKSVKSGSAMLTMDDVPRDLKSSVWADKIFISGV